MLKEKKVILSFIVGISLLLFGVTLLCLQLMKAPDVQQGSSGDAVFIAMKERGISSDTSEVVVSNFHSGARAEMVFRIHNATGKAIKPEIYFVPYYDVANYPQADNYVNAPNYVKDWLEIPELSDVTPGQIKDFKVSLVMPKNSEKPPEKMGFKVGVAGEAYGVFLPTVEVWWLVNMR